MDISIGINDKRAIKVAVQPLNSTESPFSKSLKGKNLTGTLRHLRDLAADVHGIVQQWNDNTLEGINILKSIIQEKSNKNYTVRLQDYCDSLEEICRTLSNLVKTLEQIAHQINVLITLDKTAIKLFTTWPISAFGRTVEVIYTTYNNEMQIKYKVLENIAHCHTEPQKMLYLSAWLHQPLLPKNVTILLEAMLTETGHR
ncbi:cyclin-dependent kinase 2-interacting protein-like [Vespa velutina]|uniref:cyclin-dependent kinase 2-interacting protein-like n=1 Tax=Vespa velutina TaxID=202808 RepID=UPI001FB3CF2C|nr:cyclin-dependent kinase 2-interacting protein-like [Vespa velutina]XP_047348619.1 cyclin-dependent kinase 2-interacting protein-like [Vespa velutina]